MEEFFHLYLKHEPDRVRAYVGSGGRRVYNSVNEQEAAGTGIKWLRWCCMADSKVGSHKANT